MNYVVSFRLNVSDPSGFFSVVVVELFLSLREDGLYTAFHGFLDVKFVKSENEFRQ